MPSPRPLLPILGAALALLPLGASAATLCVNTSGSNGCYTTIGAAVAAAAANDFILVSPGTYKESVVITKPVSLTGELATIDATGLSRGIFVDGMSSPNLSQVHIGGFILKNANFEGILIANASSSSVSANVVMNNNKALVNGTCPGIEAFEPGEQMDCGEGIHLLGADHVLVVGNIVHDNSGGILLSDDTGPNHDNLISANKVSNNPFACGIVLASHVPAAITGSMTPLGVFHNTVYGNTSEKNGLAIGGGAGVGIFASIPGASAYGNVVANNALKNNGLPGIALHAHTPGQKLTDNMLVANTIDSNGPDNADAATSGPTGINLFAVSPATGNIAALNTIRNEDIDISSNTPALLQTQFNNLLGGKTGVANDGANTIDATWNWWGCPFGPNEGGNCASTTGPNILTTPWLPFSASLSNLTNFQIFSNF